MKQQDHDSPISRSSAHATEETSDTSEDHDSPISRSSAHATEATSGGSEDRDSPILRSSAHSNEATSGGSEDHNSLISRSSDHANEVTSSGSEDRDSPISRSSAHANEVTSGGSEDRDSPISSASTHKNSITIPYYDPNEAITRKHGTHQNPIIVTSSPNTNKLVQSRESGFHSFTISSLPTQINKVFPLALDTQESWHQLSIDTNACAPTHTHKQVYQPVQFEVTLTLRKLGARHNIVTSLQNVNEATAHALGARGNLVSSSHDTYDEEASGELGQRYSSTYSSSSTQTNAATPCKLQTHLSGITSWPTQINAATPRKLQTRLSGGTRSPAKINAATLRKLQTRVSGESLPSKVAVSEENIYLLCKKLCDDGLADPDGSDLFVIFISNEKKQIPLWHQKASQRAEGVILWDYHVICLQKKRDEKSSSLVWDLDSSLPFPSPLGTYVAESIRPSIQIFSEFKRFFRVVHAPIFLRHFASDRRHMKDSAGNWIAEPPSHEAIVAKDGAVHNLNEYITVSPDDVVIDVGADTVNVVFSDKLGVVVGENDLFGFFSLIS
ncbi:Protein N-terminal glutamine amidohydrolase [Capsicum baccatum]|uniref:Protein N-terminal glutamine amidohydrolase n=1 Tax=Capsicum baccatum TaxID=33114 RepID=A0A2G2XAD6_CAPBA|nr:Protein N-terminal glutamine amidohydrolase [Capsicum baccatum]